jgi:hypothetical protein
MTITDFFAGHPTSRQIFDALHLAIDTVGANTLRVTKSQVAFRRKRAFAWAWMPGIYLHGKTAPLVLSVALCRRAASPRWKEVVQPTRTRFMHHLELYSPEEVDGDVLRWLQEAWELAG